MPPTKANDLVALVDQDDRPIGSIRRGRLETAKGLHYRTAHAFLFSGQSLLLQELGADQSTPLRLGSSVAAYVRPQESYKDAVARRALEELGLSLNLDYVGKIEMADTGGTKHVALFATYVPRLNVRIREPGHVAAVRWLKVDEIAAMLVADPASFTPTFLQLFRRFYPDGYRRIARSA